MSTVDTFAADKAAAEAAREAAREAQRLKKEAEIEEAERKVKLLKVELDALDGAENLSGQDKAAMMHINKYSKWATAIAVAPIPIVDLVGVTAIQMKMVRMIALEYNVKYEDSSMKGFIGSLLGAIVPVKLGYGAIGSLIKAVPVVGSIAGLLSVPTFAYASTRAVGRVFMVHFASGGTLLNFDPSAIRQRFRGEFDKAQQTAPAETGRVLV